MPGTPDSNTPPLVPPAACAPAGSAETLPGKGLDARRFFRWPNSQSTITDPSEGARRALIVGRIIVGLVTVGLLALLGRVVQLQVRPPQPIARLEGTQRTNESLLPRRGTLLDCQGRPINGSRVAERLFVDPHMSPDLSTFAERIGYRLGYDPAWVARTIDAHPNRRYVVLDRRLNESRLDKMQGFRLAGLGVEQRVVREYPQGSLAGQLLGFVNADGHGSEGLEKMFDKELAGTPGKLTYLRDARRRPLFIDEKSYQPPVDGHSVRLSIDLIIQSIAESELANACQTYSAEGGELIVMDPYSGEILAMANYPSVDLNQYGSTKPEKRQNRSVTWTYEPGSTFKPFIWSKALEAGVFSPSESINCTSSGLLVFPTGRHLRDAHPSGTVTADEVLVKSSNIGMGLLGTRLGNVQAYNAMKAFGFGSLTGSGLPGEVPGKVWPLKRWSKYSITSVSMGQEVSVTALQMARAFCAFANGGMLVSPTIRARDTQSAAILEQILKPDVAAHTRQVLRRVVTEGTGKKADSAMYAIFGKTGTAQIAGKKGGYIPDAYVGSFVCGAPVENPRLVVICAIHHPDRSKGHFGGTVAAPAARHVMEQSLVYLGVPPAPPTDSPHPARLAQR